MSNDMLSAAKQHLEAKRAEVNGISAAFKTDEKGNFIIEKKQYGDYMSAVNEAKEAKAFIDSIESKSAIDKYLDEPVVVPDAAQGFGAGAGLEAKSLADVFMDGEYKSARGEGREGWHKHVDRLAGELEGKSLHSLTGGSVTHQALGQVENVGISERAMRKTRIRDLFPKSTTKASLLYGVIETGWVNNAKQVRQRYAANGTSPATGADTDVYGQKPKSKITMRPVTYPVATIAHTLDTHKNLLDDEPRLRTFLNTRMTEGVKYAEDFDLLHSVGGSEELTGLFNVEGVQEYPGLASDKYSVQVRRAITRAQLAEYDPTGIVISPEMWEAIEVEEDGYGGFRVAVNVAIGAVKQLWHLDVACTTAMSDENFLIGSFGLGAQLHDREAVSVTMSTENKDNYERNVVTFRAEERLALEVPRPESFVVGTWTDYVAPV
jgi:HK97 family phage major capsid protein